MNSEPAKIVVNRLRHRGAVCSAAHIALTARAFRFFSPSEKKEDVENELMSGELMDPRELVVDGHYKSESGGPPMLEFSCSHTGEELIEARVTAAFYHNAEAHGFYGYPDLRINGKSKGNTKQLVAVLRQKLNANGN